MTWQKVKRDVGMKTARQFLAKTKKFFDDLTVAMDSTKRTTPSMLLD